ncbi:MAG: sodium:solute symporter [Sphingobacteriaceae bacterium]|nr:sodium:solute symporter [Sphingobacteriaceae bacterium]
MPPYLVISFILLYFLFLLGIGWLTSRKGNAGSYFIGNRQSAWYLVAFGMIGDSLSGVTYISVPGAIGYNHFSYLQLVFGYFAGYFIISHVLLPIYYKLQLVSIYEYLNGRFGRTTQKTGSIFFIISRLLGAAGRLYLAASVIQTFVFDQFTDIKIPFSLSVFIILILMLLYTYKGGIKTLVYTDTFQSLFLVLGVVLSIAVIVSKMDIGLWEATKGVFDSDYSKTFFFDFQKSNFILKEFIGGAFIAVAMTGLDQNMMQKNLSCRSLKEAKKNIFWFSVVMVIVNVFFLSLGVLIYQYYAHAGIDLPINADTGKVITDRVFPNLALNHMGAWAGLVFIVGLTAATFSSADSVLTTLTTSAYIDILEWDKDTKMSDKTKQQKRILIHIGFTLLLWIIIILFDALNQKAIIDTVLMIAGYTYGPLLALFGLGLFTKLDFKDKMIPIACIAGPLICYAIKQFTASNTTGYQIGNELILINAIITGLCLLAFTKKPSV